MLSSREAKDYYDRFGARQDEQGYYEDEPLAMLVGPMDLGNAAYILEMGCGTGRFAEVLLEEHVASDTRYFGIDISETMVGLARERLTRFGGRAVVEEADGVAGLPVGDQECDRVIAAYVLDLLDRNGISAFVSHAHKVLKPGGLIGVASLTNGETMAQRAMSAMWKIVHTVAPRRVGGCRPLDLKQFFDGDRWRLRSRNVITQSGIPSEVLVAEKL